MTPGNDNQISLHARRNEEQTKFRKSLMPSVQKTVVISSVTEKNIAYVEV
jgi:hypothetical protein